MESDLNLGHPAYDALIAGLSVLREVPGWLRAPLQPQTVLDALRRQLPEVKVGQLTLLNCKIKRLVLMEATGLWEGTYTLKVCYEPGGEEQNLSLHGRLAAPSNGVSPTATASSVPLGSPGWSCFLPELNLKLEMEAPEAELSSLPQLVDAGQAGALIDHWLHENGHLPAGVSVTACVPKILSYKPGSRGIIHYDIEYTAGSTSYPQAVIGKTYRKASKAQNAYEGMSALWRSPLSAGEAVSIAQPLAFLLEQKAMFQCTLPGSESLEDLLLATLQNPTRVEMGTLLEYMQKTAAGLAALHRCGVEFGEKAGIERRLSPIRELVEMLSVPFPQLENQFAPLLAYLVNFNNAYAPDPTVPTHGTFNPEQVLIDGKRIGFIDFDDYCMAEPALDVGFFRSAIKDTGLNALDFSQGDEMRQERISLLDEICDVFLEAYAAYAPISRPRVALWEALEYLRNSLHVWVKVKLAEPDHALFTLERHLQSMLHMTESDSLL